MDGLPEMFQADLPAVSRTPLQRTIKAAIGCIGTGLHTGRRVSLTLRPAPAGSGIVFRRSDLGQEIVARHDWVTDARLCTALADPARPDARIGTVEHLMAALAGAGIDNLLAEIDGPELPILDGSAAPFLFLIECAGLQVQAAPRPVIEILRPVRVESEAGFVELRPHAPGGSGLDLAVSIEFDAPAIGRQALSLSLTPAVFRHQLASARTFTLATEVEQLRAAGLGRGGSLENAVVVDGARVLNPAGLRMVDEFVRHKMLDVVGDLALAGAPISGRFLAHRPGHALTNALLRALFAQPAAWSRTVAGTTSLPRVALPGRPLTIPVPAAAAPL
ncbi:MAG TPA: UDP-3-O-acyl-N-acetylglucosamine deacetylase [Acetobacteraceae bacterium]|nr:UDP-3-O-acyl-N-acetylglucosamine deacetylase [Acetobacteraceae bacterium]